MIEHYHRTTGKCIEEHELEDFTSGKAVIAGIIEHYNQVRLHSSLNFLRPVDYYRGDPETLLAQRRRKLQELRKQENLKLRQRLIPWTGGTLLFKQAACPALIETNQFRRLPEEFRGRAVP